MAQCPHLSQRSPEPVSAAEKTRNINDSSRAFRRDPGLCGRCGHPDVPEEKVPAVIGEEDDSAQPARAR